MGNAYLKCCQNFDKLVIIFAKLLHCICSIFLLNANVSVICHSEHCNFAAAVGSPGCWDRSWRLAGDLCELGVKKIPKWRQEQENYSALRKWQYKIYESKGWALFKYLPVPEEGKGRWSAEKLACLIWKWSLSQWSQWSLLLGTAKSPENGT